jgi:hypothetical protein
MVMAMMFEKFMAYAIPLLRAPRKRPRGRRAANQRDELAPSHPITSSAQASNVGGISRPSAFAVLRLMISSATHVFHSLHPSAKLGKRRIAMTSSVYEF